MKVQTILQIAMAMVFVTLPAWSAHGATNERVVSSKEITSVRMNTLTDVIVTAGANPQIKIKWYGGEPKIKALQGTLKIKNTVPGAERIAITMPKHLKLIVTTINGSITVSNLNGLTRLSTVNGNIKASNCHKSLEIEAVDGNLQINGASGDLSFKTVSGNIVANGLNATTFEVKSVSGNLKLSGVTAKKARMATHSGDIVFKGKVLKDGQLTAKSFSGDLDLSLPAQMGFELVAKTRSGTIDVARKLSDAHLSNRKVTGRTGAGEVDISLSSFSGNIRIVKLSR